jgi:hypothetical protein
MENRTISGVMAGLVPAIHALLAGKNVDARNKSAHDGCAAAD